MPSVYLRFVNSPSARPLVNPPVPDPGLIGRTCILCKRHAPIVGVMFPDSKDGQTLHPSPRPSAWYHCSSVKRVQRGTDSKMEQERKPGERTGG